MFLIGPPKILPFSHRNENVKKIRFLWLHSAWCLLRHFKFRWSTVWGLCSSNSGAGPWHLMFALGRLTNFTFLIKSMCWALGFHSFRALGSLNFFLEHRLVYFGFLKEDHVEIFSLFTTLSIKNLFSEMTKLS